MDVSSQSLPQSPSVFPLRLPSVPSQLHFQSAFSVSPWTFPLNVPLTAIPLSVPSQFPLSPLNFPSQSHCGHSLLMSPSQHSLLSSPSVPPFSPVPSDQPHSRATFPLELTHSQAPASKPASLYKHFLLCLDRLPQPKTGLEDWSSYTSTDFHTGSQPENQVV